MNVHAYILCYNEEEIIAHTLAFYSKFCSKIFLMDNMSTDGTLDIAATFEKVTVLPWEDDAVDQRLFVKMKEKTYRDYSRQGGQYTEDVADWVIACDADELLYHPDILAQLAKYKQDGITVPRVAGFNMVDARSISSCTNLIEEFRLGVRTTLFDKRIVFDSDFDIHYSVGCHPIGPGFEHMLEEYNYKTNETAELALLHYKHIGQRPLDTARKGVAKAPQKEGRYVGTPKFRLKLLGSPRTPEQRFPDRTLVIGDDGHIRFDAFRPDTLEELINRQLPETRFSQAKALIELALDLESKGLFSRIDTCLSLAEIAGTLNPRSQRIRAKLEFYRDYAAKPARLQLAQLLRIKVARLRRKLWPGERQMNSSQHSVD